MFIYIDESGSFVYAGHERHAYSCAGALTIPGRFHGQVLKSFARLKRQWHKAGSELKGKDLNEAKVASVIDILLEGNAHFHVCATDMAYNTPSAMSARKNTQADHLMAHITDQHKPELVQKIRDIQSKIRALPDQLFVQFCVMTELVNKHLQDVVIHYALVDPPELGEFRWVVDRKGERKTTYEDIWHTLLSPFIQGRQLTRRHGSRISCIEGGDYSYFERYCDQISKWPRHLPARKAPDTTTQPINVIDISKILRDSFALGDSAAFPGLQLADIATNTFRRAISGRLQYEGWKDLGKLMFRWGDKAACMVHFADSTATFIPIADELTAQVITQMAQGAKFVFES
jgi:hypothetical protein